MVAVNQLQKGFGSLGTSSSGKRGVFYCLLNSSKAETAYYSSHHCTNKASLRHLIKVPMLRRLSLGLLASAISIAALPAIAQEDGGADDLGVMSISLKESSSQPLGFKVHYRELEHRIKPVLVGSCLSLLATTASGSLMSSLMPTLLITATTAA